MPQSGQATTQLDVSSTSAIGTCHSSANLQGRQGMAVVSSRIADHCGLGKDQWPHATVLCTVHQKNQVNSGNGCATTSYTLSLALLLLLSLSSSSLAHVNVNELPLPDIVKHH